MAAPDAVGMPGDTPCSATDARCCPQQALLVAEPDRALTQEACCCVA